MTFKAKAINNVFLVFGIFCFLYWLAMGIFVRFGQSLLFLWPVFGLASLLRWFLWRWAWKRGEEGPGPRWFRKMIQICFCAGMAVFLFVECFVCSGAFHKAPDGLRYIIVLGARVNDDGPSGSLRERCDAAAAYLRKNKDCTAIVSGGQGTDEPMSEAQCMYDLLTAAGIDPQRIIMEDKSTDTVENLRNSFPLLPEGTEEAGLVTNDFHIFRAICTGRRQNEAIKLQGIPARSSFFGFIHYAMREFCGLAVHGLKGNLKFF